MIPLLIRLGLSQAAAKRLAPLAVVILAVVAVAVAVVGFEVWRRHDNAAAVKADKAEGNADFRERQVTAERKAGADKAARDGEARKNLDALEDKVDEANRNSTSAADDVWNGGLWN